MKTSPENDWHERAILQLSVAVVRKRDLSTTIGRVEHLYKQMADARRRGMRWHDIAAALSDATLTLKANSVESAMRRVSAERNLPMPEPTKLSRMRSPDRQRPAPPVQSAVAPQQIAPPSVQFRRLVDNGED